MDLPVSPVPCTLTDWLSVNDQFIIPHKHTQAQTYYTQKVTVSLYIKKKNYKRILSQQNLLKSSVDYQSMQSAASWWAAHDHWYSDLPPGALELWTAAQHTLSQDPWGGGEREGSDRSAPVFTNTDRQHTSPKYESSGEISHTTNPLRSGSTLTEPLCEQWTAL